MAIDDPIGITIRQAEEAVAPSLPALLTKLGLSGLAAQSLAQMPFVAQMVTGVLNLGSVRFERRLLVVLKEMDSQLKRIEKSIPDRDFYQSEEFYSHFHLVAEKLNATHDEEKLRAFGDALANDGSKEFDEDPKEDFFHVLRDLTSADLKTLKRGCPFGHLNEYEPNLGRLVGFGLVD